VKGNNSRTTSKDYEKGQNDNYFENFINIPYLFLKIANRFSEMNPLLEEFVLEIKKLTKCDSVGIRILDTEGSIPYEAYQGFSDEFYQSESPLSIKSDKCMCINVIKGDTDSELPFYTKRGSFFMNTTTKFLATVSEEEKGETRNICNLSGYESVALIAISLENRILGLIHLADHHENMVPLEIVEILENVAMQLATAIQRVWIQQELKDSEERFRQLFNTGFDAVIILNEDKKIIDVNETTSKLLNYDKEEILNLSLKDIIHEKDRTKMDEIIDNFKKNHLDFKSETTFLTNERKSIIMEAGFTPLKIKNRNFIVGSFRDITERKESEKALIESERRLKEAQALGKIGYWEFDITNQHITWSDQVFEIYNRDPSLGPPSVDEEANYYTPNTNERLKEYARRAIEFGEQFDYDFQVNLPSGMVVQLTSLMRSIKNKSGQIIKLVGTVQDITERKEKEKEIFDLAQFPSEDPYPILRVNRKGVIYINDAGQKLLNVVESDQIPEIFQESVKNTFESNQISESEVELENKVYSFITTPIKDADYVNIYGMDITERKHVEENLKEINKLKSEFLRRASHELKTPLISIKGFSDLILSLYTNQLDPVIISKVREISDGCERLQNIINNLLETSRLESPELKPKVKKEDLSFLIKFCVHELESLAETRKKSIKIDVLNDLYVNIEKEEIHDVLSNLLTNAIKYTPPMGKIEVKTELEEEFVVVSISDNGIGFTEKQKTKIFQQFGKIERYGQGLDLGIGGTGLGLYISKKIVESHGGKIWMESEGKNRGSTFYFTLPTLK